MKLNNNLVELFRLNKLGFNDEQKCASNEDNSSKLGLIIESSGEDEPLSGDTTNDYRRNIYDSWDKIT